MQKWLKFNCGGRWETTKVNWFRGEKGILVGFGVPGRRCFQNELFRSTLHWAIVNCSFMKPTKSAGIEKLRGKCWKSVNNLGKMRKNASVSRKGAKLLFLLLLQYSCVLLSGTVCFYLTKWAGGVVILGNEPVEVVIIPLPDRYIRANSFRHLCAHTIIG